MDADEELLATSKKALFEVRKKLKLPLEATAEGYIPVERMADVVKGDSSIMTDGVAVDNTTGQIFVAVNTEFPIGCTPAMLNWWFGRGCEGSKQYMRWHPGDHFSCHWSKNWYEHDGTENEIHFVSEALGADLGAKAQTLRIQFKPLTTYQVHTRSLPFALCARIGIYDITLGGWVDVGHFIHYCSQGVETGDSTGFTLKSRFWLGDISFPNDNFLRFCAAPLKLALNTKFARTFAAKFIDGRPSLFHMGLANYRHAAEEFAVLATFLQNDYEQRARK
uniref:DAPG hydrolase PhiG domain-containing protein n=1 Tax=Aureoumbra lagunensis TaxID=44058 RepID=A0A7S3JZY6_9STRA|mmetsp:Transcript_19175/g.24876  ORF Transcript_19175/g.24876 Transcript_19175/m.24876 type:complete len:278 (-) Transcript_19175:142-975(-)